MLYLVDHTLMIEKNTLHTIEITFFTVRKKMNHPKIEPPQNVVGALDYRTKRTYRNQPLPHTENTVKYWSIMFSGNMPHKLPNIKVLDTCTCM